MHKVTKRIMCGTVLVTCLTVAPVQAANWLMLQGTEPPDSDRAVHPWGFIQMEYQSTDGSSIPAGPWSGEPLAPNLIGPDLDSDSTFIIKRARLGVRGVVPKLEKVNYLMAVEGGNNAATYYGPGSLQLFDASITLNHLPYLRIRAGQFKHPGGEEALAPAYARDYINLTNVTDQLVNEFFFDGDGSDVPSIANEPNGARSSFHDIGVQLFGTVPGGGWEHSYAMMVGNGNGLARGDNNSDKDLYLYWASERVFGGKGAYRQGWKLFAWHQQGTRTLTGAGAGDYDRERTGLGIALRRNPYRFQAEYISADGMIPNGTDGCAVAGTPNNAGAVSSFNLLLDDKADGWYLDLGYQITPQLELDARYDRLDRGTDTAASERRFETLTLGIQYRFDKRVRLMANYEWREAEAPRLAAFHLANQTMDKLDDRLSLQLQAVFK